MVCGGVGVGSAGGFWGGSVFGVGCGVVLGVLGGCWGWVGDGLGAVWAVLGMVFRGSAWGRGVWGGVWEGGEEGEGFGEVFWDVV